MQVCQFIDAFLLLIVFILCYVVRTQEITPNMAWIGVASEIPPLSEHYWMLAILLPLTPFFLEIRGFYHHTLEKTFVRSLSQIFRIELWLVCIFGLLAIAFKLTTPSRSVLLAFFFLAPLVLLLRERITAWLMLRNLSRGGASEAIIVAGDVESIEQFINSLTPTQKLEMTVVDRVDVATQGISALTDSMHKHSVGRVVLTAMKMSVEQMKEALYTCEIEGVDVWLDAPFLRAVIAKPTISHIAGHDALVFRAKQEANWPLVFKSIMDWVGALLIVIVLSPVFVIVALLVRLTSRGLVIFRQQRAGLHGEPFTMYKFRSMCENAESLKADLEQFNEMEGNTVFKMQNDPRVTPIGNWLRKMSLDELPQLFNVLQGHMSLVGPRPLPLHEVERFDTFAWRRRLSVKPGITCLWQISGRSEITDFRNWVKLDLDYIDNWSFAGDIVILLRTIPVVLFRKGAK